MWETVSERVIDHASEQSQQMNKIKNRKENNKHQQNNNSKPNAYLESTTAKNWNDKDKSDIVIESYRRKERRVEGER